MEVCSKFQVVTVIPSLNEPGAATFDITLASRLTTRGIHHLVAEMYLGEGSGGIKCTARRGGTADRYGRNVDSNSIGASWAFDPNKKACTTPCKNFAVPLKRSRLDITMGNPSRPAV